MYAGQLAYLLCGRLSMSLLSAFDASWCGGYSLNSLCTVVHTGNTRNAHKHTQHALRLQGKEPWNKGQSLSQETRQKMSIAKQGHMVPRQVCAKMSRSHAGFRHSEVHPPPPPYCFFRVFPCFILQQAQMTWVASSCKPPYAASASCIYKLISYNYTDQGQTRSGMVAVSRQSMLRLMIAIYTIIHQKYTCFTYIYIYLHIYVHIHIHY